MAREVGSCRKQWELVDHCRKLTIVVESCRNEGQKLDGLETPRGGRDMAFVVESSRMGSRAVEGCPKLSKQGYRENGSGKGWRCRRASKAIDCGLKSSIVDECHLMVTIVVESGRKWSKAVRLCLKLSIVVEIYRKRGVSVFLSNKTAHTMPTSVRRPAYKSTRSHAMVSAWIPSLQSRCMLCN